MPSNEPPPNCIKCLSHSPRVAAAAAHCLSISAKLMRHRQMEREEGHALPFKMHYPEDGLPAGLCLSDRESAMRERRYELTSFHVLAIKATESVWKCRQPENQTTTKAQRLQNGTQCEAKYHRLCASAASTCFQNTQTRDVFVNFSASVRQVHIITTVMFLPCHAASI